LESFKQTKDSAELADKESLNETPSFQGWLKEVWGKWPGDESIEALLAALKND
jgi:uncharacterized protein CbrC (UPF0167 family)